MRFPPHRHDMSSSPRTLVEHPLPFPRIYVKQRSYIGCVRAILCVTPSHVVVAQGSQVKYFVSSQQEINEWRLVSCLLFSSTLYDLEPNVSSDRKPSEERKYDAVCGLTGFPVSGDNDLGREKQHLTPFVNVNVCYEGAKSCLAFAFGLHAFHMYRVTAYQRDTDGLWDPGVEAPVSSLKSCFWRETDARVLDIYLSFHSQMTSGQRTSSHLTSTLPDSQYTGYINIATLFAASALNSIDIYVLHYKHSDDQYQLSSPVYRLQCDQKSLLFSFCILPKFRGKQEDSYGFFGGTATGQILCWHTRGCNLTWDSTQRRSRNVGPCCFDIKSPLRKATPTWIRPCEQVLSHHCGAIFRIKPFLEGQYLLAASEDRTLSLWESRHMAQWEYTLLSVCEGHLGRIWDMDAVVDRDKSPLVISAGEDNLCCLWNIQGQLLHQFRAHQGRGVMCLTASSLLMKPSRDFMVITGGGDGAVKLWDFQNPIETQPFSRSHLCNGVKQSAQWEFNLSMGDVVHVQLDHGADDPRDWVRDIVVLSENDTALITNFGRFLHVKRRCIQQTDVRPQLTPHHLRTLHHTHNNVKHCDYADPPTHIEPHQESIVVRVMARLPFLLTCMCVPSSLADVSMAAGSVDSTEVMTSETQLNHVSVAFVGTSCGRCVILLNDHVCKDDPVIDTQCGINVTETEQLGCDVRHQCTDSKNPACLQILHSMRRYLSFCVFQASRVQRVFAFSARYLGFNSKLYQDVYVVAVSNHKGIVEIYWIDLNQCVARCVEDEKDALHKNDATPQGVHYITQLTFNHPGHQHDNRLFSCAMVASLPRDTREDPQGTTVHSVQLCMAFGDEHITQHLGIQRTRQNVVPLQGRTRLPWYQHRLSKKEACKIHSLALSGRETWNQKDIVLYATVNDGSVYSFAWDLNGDCSLSPSSPVTSSDSPLVLKRTLKIPKVHVVWQCILCPKRSTLVSYVGCFQGPDFLLWCPKTQSELWRFRCGGARRPFHLAVLHRTIPAFPNECIAVASVTGNAFFVRTMQCRVENHLESLQPPENITPLCSSITPAAHGRSVWCAVWVSESHLCTGGEDGCICEMTWKPQLGFQLDQGENSIAVHFTHSDAPAAIRCLYTSTVILKSQPVQFVVAGGARQYIAIYHYRWLGWDSPALVLVYRDQLALGHDERISTIFFLTETPFDESSHASTCERETSWQPLVLHLFLGMSSGKLIHHPVYLLVSLGMPSTVKTLQGSGSPCQLSSTAPKLNMRILAQHSCAVLCGDMTFQPFTDNRNVNNMALLCCGLVNGTIQLYCVRVHDYAAECHLLTSYKPHQCGTTSVSMCWCLQDASRVGPTDPPKVPCPSYSTTHATECGVLTSNAFTCPQPSTKDGLVWNTFPVADATDSSSCCAYIASAGDDNSIAVQRIHLDPLAFSPYAQLLDNCRVPTAHISSVRGICWKENTLISIGWDKILRVWTLQASEAPSCLSALSLPTNTLASMTMQYSPFSLSAQPPFQPPFQQYPLTSLRIILAASIPSQVGDAAGLISIPVKGVPGDPVDRNVSRETRVCVVGAHGVEVVSLHL